MRDIFWTKASKSQFTSAITGQDIDYIVTWGSIFRTIIPVDRLMEDDTIRPIFENEPSGFMNSTGLKHLAFVTYPCKDDTLMNVAIFHPTQDHLKDAKGM